MKKYGVYLLAVVLLGGLVVPNLGCDCNPPAGDLTGEWLIIGSAGFFVFNADYTFVVREPAATPDGAVNPPGTNSLPEIPVNGDRAQAPVISGAASAPYYSQWRETNGTYETAYDKTPYWLDIILDQNGQKMRVEAIFRFIDINELQITLGSGNSARPAEFNQSTSYVLRRVNKNAAAELTGEWLTLGEALLWQFQTDGGLVVKQYFDQKTQTWSNVLNGTYETDLTKNPDWLDLLVNQNGQTVRGESIMYFSANDTCIIATGFNLGVRPASFSQGRLYTLIKLAE
ncbi:MAG: hypothetical protein PHE50_09090 [Dehalococcoidales bacterium]|nr:hypothetical protein [Dehalococcoidales bacterium]